MIKKPYQTQMDAITPPPALEEETLALMREARDRGAAPQKRSAPKLRFLPVAAGVAAVLAVTVITAIAVPLLFSRGGLSAEETARADSAYQANRVKQSGTVADESAVVAAPELPENAGEKELLQNGNETHYTSLEQFINALELNQTPGYGKNYYMKGALAIVPTALPDYARFNGLDLDSETGNYVYSYTVPYLNAEYLLTCTVTQTLPKTLAGLEEALERVKEEAGDTWYAGNAYVWEYGGKLTAALTEKATGNPVEHEKTMEILKNFSAGRYERGNRVISMKQED